MNIFISIFLFIWGIVGLFYPEVAIRVTMFSHRWMIKGGETSEAAIIYVRFCSIIIIIFAVVGLFHPDIYLIFED